MIDRLEMFIALARERHFGRAAMAVGVTQPSLSAAIKTLEDHLGVQLVYRGARFQGLTPEGLRVLDWARKITTDARSMREELTSSRKGLSGQITLGVIPTALPKVASLTAPFLTKNPAITLRILSATSTEILSGLEDHRMDAGISYLENEPLGRVSTIPLYAETYVLLTSTKNALAKRDHLDWADIKGQPLCLLTSDMQNRRIINHHLSEAQIPTTAVIESNSVLALIAHISAGEWVSILPQALTESLAQSPDLRAIPLRNPDVSHSIGLILPGRSPHTPVIEALAQAARRLQATAFTLPQHGPSR